MDGKARALYIWRRVYGEKMAPEEGLPIETMGSEPKRYADLLKLLPADQRDLFWSHIWDLAMTPRPWPNTASRPSTATSSTPSSARA
jgi:hypothetical protein